MSGQHPFRNAVLVAVGALLSAFFGVALVVAAVRQMGIDQAAGVDGSANAVGMFGAGMTLVGAFVFAYSCCEITDLRRAGKSGRR